MKTSLIRHMIFGDLPYTKERRSPWPRVIGWVVAFACWIPVYLFWSTMP